MSWNAWKLDLDTWGWIAFILFFAIWETFTGIRGNRNQLTHHFREMIDVAPITWWLGFGVWLWMGPHFLFPALERWIHSLVTKMPG